MKSATFLYFLIIIPIIINLLNYLLIWFRKNLEYQLLFYLLIFYIFIKRRKNNKVENETGDTMRVVGVIGPKDSGKTTLICDIAKVLKERGVRFALVKHSGHPVDIDKKGTDTYRFKELADIVVFSDVRGKTTFFYENMELEEILSKLDSDLVIIEGFKEKLKELNIPKIVMTKDGKGKELIDTHTITVIENRKYNIEDIVKKILDKSVVPTYNLNCGHCGYNCKEFVEKLVREELSWKDCVLSTDVELTVDGKRIPLNPFVSKIVKNTVLGLVSSLKGVKDPKNISIKIDVSR